MKSNKEIIQHAAKHRFTIEQEQAMEAQRRKDDHDYLIYQSAEYEFKRDPITEVPDDVKLPTYYFDDVANKVKYNEYYADYYQQRFEDTNVQRYADLSERVRHCHQSWFGDHYKKSGIFNVKRVFHCHNRWCWLCSHLKQAKRLFFFHKQFEKLLPNYDLYHLVFTVPNVDGSELKSTLTKMQNGLKKIIRYFQGHGKIKGVDFTQYGFVGAIRSFEIVINPTNYHPHIHCLFMLKKDLNILKSEINRYSFEYKHSKPTRLFSELEITLQKIFFLVMHGERVNLTNIRSVPNGYSCTMDYVEGDSWHEVFKYATKMSKAGASTCTYEQFCLLDDILHNLKMLQGYGIFYNMKEPEEDNDPTAEILYEKILILLNSKEQPEKDISFFS